MKDLKNMPETRTKNKKKKTLPRRISKKNETTLYVNVEDEHSVPDCFKQIKFKIVGDKGSWKLRKIHLLKKQVKLKNAQIKELKHKEKIFSYENIYQRKGFTISYWGSKFNLCGYLM